MVCKKENRLSNYILPLVILLFLSASKTSWSQSRFGATPQDSLLCVQNLSLYMDPHFKQKNYQEAVKYWRLAVQHCPSFSKSLYINGIKMYKQFVKTAEDDAIKSTYVDTLFSLYDKRIEYFGEEGFVLGRKGADMLRYRKKDPQAAYSVLSRSKQLQDGKLEPGAIVSYYKALHLMEKQDIVEKDSVIAAYPELNDMVASGLKNAKSSKDSTRYQSAQKNIDKIFSAYASCEDLVNLYKPKFEASPDNQKLHKTILALMSRKECTDDPLYVAVASAAHKANPSLSSAMALGKLLAKKGRCGDAIAYFDQALALADEASAKEEALMAAARCSYNLKQFSKVRQYAQKAIGQNAKLGDAYMLIGDAYARSAGQCGSDNCKSKAAYWAAVDKYNAALSADPSIADKVRPKIASAKAQYPKKADCFFHSMNPGDSYTLDCWIGETTSVRVLD